MVAGIGKNVFEDDPERRKIIIDAVEGRETEDNTGRLFAQYSQQPGNDAAQRMRAELTTREQDRDAFLDAHGAN